jgi:hypothetical protein
MLPYHGKSPLDFPCHDYKLSKLLFANDLMEGYHCTQKPS